MKALREAFDVQMRAELYARNRIHHEEAYSDFELDALGQTDLLADFDESWPRMNDAGYHRIARQWRQRAEVTASKIDLWVGLVAALMLARCDFLRPRGT